MLKKKAIKLLHTLEGYINSIVIPTDDEDLNTDLGLKSTYLLEENTDYSLSQNFVDFFDEDVNFDLYDYVETLDLISDSLFLSNKTGIYIAYKLIKNNLSNLKDLMDSFIFTFDKVEELKEKLSYSRARLNYDFSKTNLVFNLETLEKVNTLFIYLNEVQYYFANRIEYCDNLLGNILPLNKTGNTIKESQSITNFIWFQVGLLFANGEIDELIIKHESNFTKIAKEKFQIKHKSFRPYISETYNNTSENNKNIWRNKSKISAVHEYCVKNKISMTSRFLEHFEQFN